MSKFITSLAALAATTALCAGAAQAAEGLTVTHGDLDLSRPADAATFQQRINKAASSWCRKEPLRTGTRIRDMRQCKTAANEAVTASLPPAKHDAYLAALKQSDAALYAERDAQRRQ